MRERLIITYIIMMSNGIYNIIVFYMVSISLKKNVIKEPRWIMTKTTNAQ